MDRVLEGRDPGELKEIVTGFLGSVPGAVLVLDKEWRLVYLNEEAEKFFSCMPSSLLGRSLEEIYPRQYGHMLAPKTIQGIIEGRSINITRYVASLDRWYKMFAYSSDSHVFVRLEDVTRDVISQRMLRLNQFSIEHSADMVFWIKPNGHIINANAAAQKSLGFKRHELAGMMITDIDPAFTRERWAKFVGDMRREESRTYESSLRTVKRTYIPVEVTYSYFVYSGEEYVVASARDITKRKLADDSLTKSEEKFRALTETSPAIVLFHQGGKYLYVNPAAERITGYSRDELLDMDFWGFIAPEYRDIVRDRGQARLRGESPTPNYQVKILTKRGEERWIEITSARMEYQGRPAIMVTALDVTERKRAEESLQESEERFRATFNQAAVGIAHVALDGRWLRFNQKLCDITGYTAEELSGMTFQDITYPGDLDADLQNVERLLAGEIKTYSMEKRYVRKDGSLVWVNLTVSPLYRDGKPENFISVIEDISERKQAEDVIRTGAINQAKAEKLANIGYWDWDLLTNKVKWSDGHFKIFNYPIAHGTETYEMFRSRVHPDDIDALEDKLQESIEKDAGYIWDFRLVWPDSSIRHVHAEAGKPVKDSEGKPVRWFGIVQDVTERKHATEALLESERRFRVFMDNSSAIAWMKDAQGRYVYVNKTYQEEFGVRPEDRLGKTDFELWPHVLAEEFRTSDLDVMVSSRPAHVIEEIPDQNGNTTYWFDVKFPFKDASGNMFVGGIAVDITRQKRTEEALKEAKTRNELYVDLMGHDINNLNQVAMGYLELALEPLSNGEKEPILNALETLKSSSNLVENVQKLKKIKSGGLRSEVIDLNDVLLELKDQYQGSVGKDIKINYEPNPGCRIMANGLLKDVFANLVGNAIKHTPADHVAIDIRLYHHDQDHKKYYKVTVEDNGPGIPDDMKLRIFNRLERGRTKARGKGLGLYLVKTLVDDFHGQVWVEDRVKGDSSMGSKFVVVLPVLESEAGTVKPDLPGIGIVEDDATLLNLYKMILTRSGMLVGHTAMNGIEAIDMVKNANPGLDAIILDHRMPGMTGLDAMREIRKISPRTKIIFISADARIEEEALKLGASIFLHKPAKPKDIVHAVNDVLADKQKSSINN